MSVIVTVRNESETIDRLIESLIAQTRQPDEVVIVDGGSTDDTWARLQQWEQSARLPLRIISAPGSNISAGRNIAIAAASGPIIASTDAGVRLDPRWLEHLVAPLAQADAPVVAAGFFVPDVTTAFDVAMGATVLPALADINPRRFLPSSRSVAFPKAAWQAVGGYPEWLDYCEDLVIDFRLRDRGYRFEFVPSACVHFQPRRSLGAFFKQYYRYARGDGKANLWFKRHLVRYATYLVLAPLILWLIATRGPAWSVLLLAGAVVMLGTPFKRVVPALGRLGWLDRVKALLWIPVIRVTGDVAKMIGYPVGLYWRSRHHDRIPDWRGAT